MSHSLIIAVFRVCAGGGEGGSGRGRGCSDPPLSTTGGFHPFIGKAKKYILNIILSTKINNPEPHPFRPLTQTFLAETLVYVLGRSISQTDDVPKLNCYELPLFCRARHIIIHCVSPLLLITLLWITPLYL